MTTLTNVRLGLSHDIGNLTFSKQNLVWRARNRNNNNSNSNSNSNNQSSSDEIRISAADIKNIDWFDSDKTRKIMSISYTDKSRTVNSFLGFADEDELEINNLCKVNLGHELSAKKACVSGANWGKFMLRSQELVFRTEDKVTFCTIPYRTISQSTIPKKNEVSLEFNEDAYQNSGGEHLCELRLYIPDDEDADEVPAYLQFHKELQKKGKLGHDNANVIAWFKNINFRMPRGKKEIKFLVDCFVFRTETFSYSIKYKQIKRLFVFEQPGDKVSFVVHLSPSIRQGAQTYAYLIMEFPSDEVCKININATEEELQTVYASKDGKQVLQPVTEGETFDVLSRVFMALSKIKIVAARKFESANGWKCVRCHSGANAGLLFPLEKALFFMWKPVLYIRHTDIQSVNVLRIGESHNIRLFDLEIKLNKKNKEQKLLFTGVDKAEYEMLMRYWLSKESVRIVDKAFHESRINNNNMKMSSRGTRTRKNLRPSADQSFGDQLENIESSDDDEDYEMDADQAMLDEDEEIENDFNDDVDEADDLLVSEEDTDEDDEDGENNNSNSNSNNNHKKKKHKHKHKHKHHKSSHDKKHKKKGSAAATGADDAVSKNNNDTDTDAEEADAQLLGLNLNLN